MNWLQRLWGRRPAVPQAMPPVPRCHFCGKGSGAFAHYRIEGKRTPVCRACQDYAERRALPRAP